MWDVLEEKFMRILVGKPEERENLEDVGLDWTIILNRS
jgi:hypothetical protein